MLRVSFTLLDMWSKGNKDDAVAYYFGSKKQTTKAMQKGKDYDTYISDFIQANSRLPDSLGGTKLSRPVNQVLQEYVDAKNDIKFVFVPDLIDSKILYEFKTGVTDLNHYLSSMQIPVYFYLLDKIGIDVDRAYLINEKQGFYILANGTSKKETAKDWLYTNAEELKVYFESLGL